MADPRKTADADPPVPAPSPGMEETGAVFEPRVRDRWTVARERLAEHLRTGAETISVDEFMAELTELIERRQASKV